MFLSPTSYEDQKEFLNTVTKPYSMSCEELGARLMVVNRLSVHLPGSALVNNFGSFIYPDRTAVKRAYFKMMPQAWKIEFIKSANKLDDNGFGYHELVRYMAMLEALSKRTSGLKRRHEGANGRGNGGGRGRGGRGNYRYPRGRGHGRGGFGRGRGSPYQGYHGQYTPYPRTYNTPNGNPGQGYMTPTTGTKGHQPPSYSGGRGNGGRTPGRGSYSGSGRAGFRPRYPTPYPQGGRGRTPYMPNFMIEPPYDQYYQEEQGYGQEQYYQGDYDHSEEQYYQDQFHQEPTGQYEESQEHYHQEESVHGRTGGDEPNEENEESHWLDGFY